MQAHAFKTEYHEEITRQALPFVKKWLLDAIIQSNHDSDSLFKCRAGKDRYHFNDCGFEAGAREVRAQYKSAILALARAKQKPGRCSSATDACAPDLLEAAKALGIMLHALQDLYAHSNWVESGGNVTIDDVFRDSDTTADQNGFPTLEHWKPQNGYVLIGAADDTTVEKFKLKPGAQFGLVSVEYNKRPLIGIMTGAYDGEDEPCQGAESCSRSKEKHACPASVAIGHWDDDVHGEGLHKDTPARPHFAEARRLAFLQTRKQWCRLDQRLRADGSSDALASLVDSLTESAQTCEPEAVLSAPPKARIYWNWGPRATFGWVTGVGPDNRTSTGIDFGARMEVRYGAVGIFGGYRGEYRGDEITNWSSVGVMLTRPNLMGGPYGALRWDHASKMHRVGIDVGKDLRLYPWMPIFTALRVEIGVGARIDENGIRPDFRVGIAGGLNVDTPY